jgi:hypothetical protein
MLEKMFLTGEASSRPRLFCFSATVHMPHLVEKSLHHTREAITGKPANAAVFPMM